MSLIPTGSLVSHAVAAGRGVAGFNVISLEHAEAIAAGAEAAESAAILQISENAIRFHGGDPRPIVTACAAVAAASSAPLAIHLDHIEDSAIVDLAIANAEAWGIGSIMVDASRLDDAANIAATEDAARRAHGAGLWVEAELGEIGGKDGAHAPGVRTDPDDAAGFVDATGVDGLAVAVGSSHAMLERTAGVDVDLVSRIAERVPVPLVLHGSSGVADAVISAAVDAGIRKVNVGTALNIASTAAVRETLAADPDLVDPRKYARPAREAMAEVVAAFLRVVR